MFQGVGCSEHFLFRLLFTNAQICLLFIVFSTSYYIYWTEKGRPESVREPWGEVVFHFYETAWRLRHCVFCLYYFFLLLYLFLYWCASSALVFFLSTTGLQDVKPDLQWWSWIKKKGGGGGLIFDYLHLPRDSAVSDSHMRVIMGTGLNNTEEDLWAVHIKRLRFGWGKHWYRGTLGGAHRAVCTLSTLGSSLAVTT